MNLAIALLVAIAVIVQVVVSIVLVRMGGGHHGVPWERKGRLPSARTRRR